MISRLTTGSEEKGCCALMVCPHHIAMLSLSLCSHAHLDQMQCNMMVQSSNYAV